MNKQQMETDFLIYDLQGILFSSDFVYFFSNSLIYISFISNINYLALFILLN